MAAAGAENYQRFQTQVLRIHLVAGALVSAVPLHPVEEATSSYALCQLGTSCDSNQRDQQETFPSTWVALKYPCCQEEIELQLEEREAPS
eukprot:jgi/Phyca11/507502/fgenesh2_kg.PHYCAscaffold_28_\